MHHSDVEMMIIILVPFAMVIIGLVCGKLIEHFHIKRLDSEEAKLSFIKECSLKNIDLPDTVNKSFLVEGSVCLATDYFKNFTANIRNFFGGKMKGYETLMTRARREALIRMKKNANAENANEIWNIRFETTTLKGKEKSAGIEIIAYGTAVIR